MIEKKSLKLKFSELVNSKLVKVVLLFIAVSIVAVIAGDVIVKEGALNVEDNLNVSGVLYVDSVNNRVGIGTANPSEKLDIEGAGTTRLEISDKTNNVTTHLKSSVDGGYVGTATNHPLFFIKNNAVEAKLNAGWLYLYGGARIKADEGTDDVLVLNAKGTGDTRVNFDSGSGGFRVYNGSGAEKFRVQADGKTGIGTTSPTQKLHVEGSINVTGDIHYGGSLNSYSPIRFGKDGEMGYTAFCVLDAQGYQDLIYFDKGNMVIEKDSSYCNKYVEMDIARRVCENSDLAFNSETLSCYEKAVEFTEEV